MRRKVCSSRAAFAAAVAFALALVTGCAACGDDSSHRSTGELASDDRSAASEARIRGAALHAVHAAAREPVACEGCHELVAGQYLQAASWRCEKCHADQHLVLHAVASVDSGARACWTCHDFTSTSKQPTACLTCHDEALQTVPAIAVHDPKHPDEDCGACHRAHAEPSLSATRCESCHQEPVSGHRKPGIQITGCASCHGYHEPASTASGRCTNCHRQSQQLVSVNATFPGGHVACTTCHRPHRFDRTEVLSCRIECHKTQVALSEGKVAQHRGCLGCHDNHDVRNSPQTACLRCHKTIVPRHPVDKVTGTPCVGCHAPHKGAGTPIAAACASCHPAAKSDHAFHQGPAAQGPVCRDCHRPHDFAKKGAGPAFCLGCHGPTPFKNAKTIVTFARHSECVRCHGATVAHAPAGKRAACVSCHLDKGAIIRKEHEKCVGCHDPHTTKQQRPCAACHEAIADKARKDHQVCVNCHEPHSTMQKKPCAGCHAAEAASAPAEHQTCMNCHDQHSTLVKRPCADCHADRASGVHAGVKGGCINCHRPHGPNGPTTPPACTSCHDPSKLPLLHQVPKHQECTTCHRSHGEQPNRKRATCVACHPDRSAHVPAAPMCFGCHPFAGGSP